MSVHTASRLSHRCYVGNTAGFLTWTTVWRGQPGGDPHLQLWLLRQQPPDFTNHTPAGGERENVWQLFTQGRRVGRRAGEEIMRFVFEIKYRTEGIKRRSKGRETTDSVWGWWKEQHDWSCMTRGHLFHCSDSHSAEARQWRGQRMFVCLFVCFIEYLKKNIFGSVVIKKKIPIDKNQ